MAASIQGLFDHLSDGLMILSPTGTVRFANQMVLQWLHAVPGKVLAHDPIIKQVHAAEQGYQRLPHAFNVESNATSSAPSTLQVIIDRSPLGEGYALVVRNRTLQERYDTVMNNFADLFRHDLSQPYNDFVEQFSQLQFRLAQMSESADLPLRAEDKAMLENGKELMERLVQLSSYAFTFSHAPLFAADRIEPATLVRALANRVGDKLRRHRLGIRIHGDDTKEMPIIYGSQTWLLEALNGYFDYIATHAQEGTVVDVHLRGFGNFVLFVITNQGRAIPVHDRHHQYKPFLTPQENKGPQHPSAPGDLGLGLPLCKRIVELHKGHLRMKEEDGELVSFEIELPAGAPVSFDQHDVSAEQAKRYAEDLAVLMQRQTRKNQRDPQLQVI